MTLKGWSFSHLKEVFSKFSLPHWAGTPTPRNTAWHAASNFCWALLHLVRATFSSALGQGLGVNFHADFLGPLFHSYIFSDIQISIGTYIQISQIFYPAHFRHFNSPDLQTLLLIKTPALLAPAPLPKVSFSKNQGSCEMVMEHTSCVFRLSKIIAVCCLLPSAWKDLPYHFVQVL